MNSLNPKPPSSNSAELNHGRHRQAGVTMIEVLIALLLIAIGALAIVALQLSSKRNNLDAEQRALAAQVGYGFLERIRGNNSPAGLVAYENAGATGFGGGLQGSTTPNPDCGSGVACSAAELAVYDAWQFEQALDGTDVQVGTNNVGGLIKPIACLASSSPGGGSTNFTLDIIWRGTGALPDNVAVTCGQGTGNYGTSDEFRRSLTLNAFVAN